MISTKFRAALAASVALAVIGQGAQAQVYRYTQQATLTGRFDPQRTGWVRNDAFINPDTVRGISLQWKARVGDAARGGAALSGGVTGPGGVGVTLAYLGASDNQVAVIETDFGHVYASRSFGPAPASTAGCLPASLATPARSATLTPSNAINRTRPGQGDNGPNRQLPASNAIGGPGEGLPPVRPGTLVAAPGAFFAPAGAQPYDGTPQSLAAGFAAAAARGASAPRGGGQEGGVAGVAQAGAAARPVPAQGAPPGAPVAVSAGNLTYALSNDGRLRGLTAQDALDAIQPIPFIPPGAQASDLLFVNNTVYTSTQRRCGGAPNGVWAIKPAPVPAGGVFPVQVSWKTGGTASPSAVAMSAGGGLYVAVGSGTGPYADSIVSLDATTLALKAKFTQGGADFTGPPVLFQSGERDIIVAQAADGRLFVENDAGQLLGSTPAIANLGGYKLPPLTYWRDAAGQDWVLTAAPTAVTAYKLVLTGGQANLVHGWTLSGIAAPLAPLVVNGVVFVAASGQYVSSTGAVSPSAAQRAGRSRPAVLHAVDGQTGAKLWNSGSTITASAPASTQLWSYLGQVIIADEAKNVYSFGTNYDRR